MAIRRRFVRRRLVGHKVTFVGAVDHLLSLVVGREASDESFLTRMQWQLTLERVSCGVHSVGVLDRGHWLNINPRLSQIDPP